MKKRIFLVKREVHASNIKEAITKSGKIYSIEETLISIDEEPKKAGFIKKE